MHPRVSGKAARIVVADDDEQMRRLVVEALRRDGHLVEHASSGEALLTRLAAELDDRCSGLDLIISDVRMPAFTGLDLLEALRATECETPVILMTAFPDEATRLHARRLNAVLFDKPFDVDDLRTATIHLLRSA
jgi:DNA-binding response OmpR family regulator